MTSIKDAMNSWGRGFLRDHGHEVEDDAEITFEDDTESSGSCETCYYEEYVVRVSDGSNTKTYYGSMTRMLEAMQEGVYY